MKKTIKQQIELENDLYSLSVTINYKNETEDIGNGATRTIDKAYYTELIIKSVDTKKTILKAQTEEEAKAIINIINEVAKQQIATSANNYQSNNGYPQQSNRNVISTGGIELDIGSGEEDPYSNLSQAARPDNQTAQHPNTKVVFEDDDSIKSDFSGYGVPFDQLPPEKQEAIRKRKQKRSSNG